MLADESFCVRERSLLSRLEVGLVDEGVRVVHAVPAQATIAGQSELFSQAVTYKNHGLAISRSWRAQQLVAAVEEATEGDGRPADIVHVFGPGAWAMGFEVARQLGSALAIEVFSAEQAEAAARLRPPHGCAAPIFFVPDTALERRLRAEDPGIPERVTPWGVHTPPAARPGLESGRAPSLMIAASGRDPAGLMAALEGLAAVSARTPELMAFAEEESVRRAGVWPAIKRLGMTERFTLIPDMESRRELALRGDVLLLPEARGVHRSLTLDAMAAGMIVLAEADPMVSVLMDHRTARLVQRPTAEQWSAAIGWVVDEPAAAHGLGLSAREFVRAHCRASAHVAAVVDAYEWMTAAESIPFSAGA